MLDGVGSGFHRALDVKRFRIDGHFQSQFVCLLHCRFDFVQREMTSQLDDVRSFVKLFAHRQTPVVRAGCNSCRAHRLDPFVGSVLRRMSALGGDELSRGKNSRTSEPVVAHPLFQTKCHVALRTDVASASLGACRTSASFNGYVRCVCRSMSPGRIVLPEASTTSAFFGHSVDDAGTIFEILLRSMTRLPSRAAVPVPSKILPPRKTRTRSGP